MNGCHSGLCNLPPCVLVKVIWRRACLSCQNYVVSDLFSKQNRFGSLDFFYCLSRYFCGLDCMPLLHVSVHGWKNMEMIFSFMSKSVLVSCNTSKILGLALQQYLVIQTSALAVNWWVPLQLLLQSVKGNLSCCLDTATLIRLPCPFSFL